MPKTVWSHDALPLVPARYQALYTVLMPVVDFLLLVFSGCAIFVGSKVVADFTLHFIPVVWALVFALGSILATIGTIFLRDYVTIVGEMITGSALVFYAFILSIYVVNGSPSSMLSIMLALIAVMGLGVHWRDTITQIGRKEAVK